MKHHRVVIPVLIGLLAGCGKKEPQAEPRDRALPAAERACLPIPHPERHRRAERCFFG